MSRCMTSASLCAATNACDEASSVLAPSAGHIHDCRFLQCCAIAPAHTAAAAPAAAAAAAAALLLPPAALLLPLPCCPAAAAIEAVWHAEPVIKVSQSHCARALSADGVEFHKHG